MQSIFKIISTIPIWQSLIFGIGTQFLAIPTTVPELISGINPANAQAVNRPIISASYGNWLANMKVSSFEHLQKGLGGTIGFNMRYVALNDLELRLETPSQEPLAVFNAAAISLDGHYDRQIKIGTLSTKIRYISLNLFDESAHGFAGDLGLRRKINSKLNFGIAILNLGYMSKLQHDKPKLPTRFVAGSSFNHNISKIDNTILIAVEKSTSADGIILRSSALTKRNKLQISLGTQFSEKVMSVSGGIGLRFGIYQFRYGIQVGSQGLGTPQLFDISIILP